MDSIVLSEPMAMMISAAAHSMDSRLSVSVMSFVKSSGSESTQETSSGSPLVGSLTILLDPRMSPRSRL